MKSFLAMVILFSLPIKANRTWAQSYDCYEDGGNVCLDQCKVFADTGYDYGKPYPLGPYTTTAIYPQCTATCEAHAIGIDYQTYKGYPCYDYQDRRFQSRLEELRSVAMGVPIFATSCSGQLVDVDLLNLRNLSLVAATPASGQPFPK